MPADHDWEFARDEEVLYGPRGYEDDAWIVLPRRIVDELLPFAEASTWGELRRRCTPERFTAAVEASGMLEWEEFEGEDATAIPDDQGYQRFDLTSDNAASPYLPEPNMEDWLPSDIAEAFGRYDHTMFGDRWLVITEIDDLLHGLRSVGARCERDDATMLRLWDA